MVVREEVTSYKSEQRTQRIKRTVWARIEGAGDFEKRWSRDKAPKYWGNCSKIPYFIKDREVWCKIHDNWIFDAKPKASDFRYSEGGLEYKVPREWVALSSQSNDSHNNFLLLPTSIILDDFFWEGLGLQQGDGSQELRGCHVTFTNSCLPLIAHQLRWFNRLGVSNGVMRVYLETPKDASEVAELERVQGELITTGITKLQFRKTKGGKTSNVRNTVVQLVFHNRLFKIVYVFLLQHLQETITDNEDYAKAYIKGILAAEGCVRLCKGVVSSIKISVSPEKRRMFYRECLERISIMPSRDELTKGSEAVVITGFDNFARMYEMGSLGLHPLKREKFTVGFKNYERAETYFREGSKCGAQR